MTGHTPGPWNFRLFAAELEEVESLKAAGLKPIQMLTNEGQAIVMTGNDEDARRVALVDCQTKFKRGYGYKTECAERDANAHLIAAAPDMLEALKTARNHCIIWQGEPNEYSCGIHKAVIAAIDAAIAKAQGKPKVE